MTASGAAGPCPGCGGADIGPRLDVGERPLCNRFLAPGVQQEYTHPLALGQCTRCGLVRILDPVPVPELKPRYDWISYREPEEHLDRLVETLATLPGFDAEAVIGGVSYKDDTTLERFARRGNRRTWRVDSGRRPRRGRPCA